MSTNPLFKSVEFENLYQQVVMDMCNHIVNDAQVNSILSVVIDEYGLDFDHSEAMTEAQENELDHIVNAFFARLGTDILQGFLLNNIGLTPQERTIENQEAK